MSGRNWGLGLVTVLPNGLITDEVWPLDILQTPEGVQVKEIKFLCCWVRNVLLLRGEHNKALMIFIIKTLLSIQQINILLYVFIFNSKLICKVFLFKKALLFEISIIKSQLKWTDSIFIPIFSDTRYNFQQKGIASQLKLLKERLLVHLLFIHSLVFWTTN